MLRLLRVPGLSIAEGLIEEGLEDRAPTTIYFRRIHNTRAPAALPILLLSGRREHLARYSFARCLAAAPSPGYRAL